MQTTVCRMDKHQGSTIQHPVINHNGKECKENVYICIIESLCFIAEIKTAL